jgi:hypothetical protein
LGTGRKIDGIARDVNIGGLTGVSDRRLGAVSLLPAFERNPLFLSLEGGQIG